MPMAEPIQMGVRLKNQAKLRYSEFHVDFTATILRLTIQKKKPLVKGITLASLAGYLTSYVIRRTFN